MTHERQRADDTRQATLPPYDPRLSAPVPSERDVADAAARARRAQHDEYYVRLPRRRDGSA